MTARQLRAMMKRYGNGGVLLVAAYLLLHEGWRHRRVPLLLGIVLVIILGGCLLLLKRKASPVPPLLPPVPKITQAPVVSNPRPTWQPILQLAREKLEDAEQKLPHSSDASLLKDYGEDALKEVEETVQESLDLEVSGRGYADLGEIQLKRYHYEDVVRPFSRALEISPEVESTKAGLERARYAHDLWTSVKNHLPSEQHIDKMFPFPMRGRKLWAVLTSEESKNGGFPEENVRLSLYEEKDRQLTSIWHSEVIPSIDDRGYYHPELWAFPMTGSKIPELVFRGICSGGSASPTLLHIYRWNGRTFHKVLEAYSGEQPLWIEDIRHTKRYQVRCVEYIGNSLGHSDANHVRWAHVYAWNGSRYIEADAQYPDAFQKAKGELLDCLQNNPEDPELLEYLGKVYLYEHKHRLAFATFDKMERACHKFVSGEPYEYDSHIYVWRDLGEVLEIKRERKKAVHCYREVERLCQAEMERYPNPSDQEQFRLLKAEAAKRIRYLRRGSP